MPEKTIGIEQRIFSGRHLHGFQKYQDIKLKELEMLRNLNRGIITEEKSEITDKACLCVGLVNAAYMEQDLEIKGRKQGVVICPGPNIAFFDKEVPFQKW
jgi:hypothetical protein